METNERMIGIIIFFPDVCRQNEDCKDWKE